VRIVFRFVFEVITRAAAVTTRLAQPPLHR